MAHTTTREQKTRMLCTAGLMAALACVSNFISIATPASRIHIGNAVCVLSGLLLGPLYGFFAAAIGNGASSGLVLAIFFTSMMSCTVGAGRAGYTGGMLV